MSNSEIPVGRKKSKICSELFDDKVYGNSDYPEINYKLYNITNQKRWEAASGKEKQGNNCYFRTRR